MPSLGQLIRREASLQTTRINESEFEAPIYDKRFSI